MELKKLKRSHVYYIYPYSLLLCSFLLLDMPKVLSFIVSFLFKEYSLAIQKDVNDNPICRTEKKKKTQIYRTVFWTLWEKARVGCFKRTASKHVYHLGWNGSPAQVGCMRQVLGPGALRRPRGIGWRGMCVGGDRDGEYM